VASGSRSLGAAESFTVFAEIPQGSVHDSANLLIELVLVSPVFGQPHPTKLDGLADELIDMSWPKKLGHSLFSTFAFAHGNSFDHGISLLDVEAGLFPNWSLSREEKR
jgi:hypothetical protein